MSASEGQVGVRLAQLDVAVPDHVPRDRVLDVRFADGAEANDLPDPYILCDELRGEDVPRILYSPFPRGDQQTGAWGVAHYEDIRRVYEDSEHFSTEGVAQYQSLIGEHWPSIPLGIDPPDHAKYRKFLNPHFTPVAMNKMEPQIRAVAVQMIEEFASKGQVDAAYDFGRVFPVRIFLDLMGYPFAMFEQFLAWEYEILHSQDMDRMAQAMRGVIDYLRGFIAEKQHSPDDKLGSKIVHGEIEGRPLTEDEKIGMIFFLWLGGLDTVASTLSQMFRRLAMDIPLQDRLRAEPELVPTAVDEFLRMQPLVNSSRKVKKDFQWHGVDLKKGDWVFALNTSGNFDPQQFSCPRQFDPARKANRHYTLAGGPHLCLGAHLAKRELRVVLTEWLARIPSFEAKEGADLSVVPGLLSIRNLPLVWTPK